MPAQPDLEHLYEEHARALYAFLLNLLRQEADVRDVLQEVFVKLARNPGALASVRNVRSYLLSLAHNLAIDVIRRRGTREQNQERWGTERTGIFATTTDPDEAAFREQLATAMGELPPEQRAVMHLKLWEGLTFEEIAEALNLSPNTAASRYRYGLDKLRERLRPLYEEIK